MAIYKYSMESQTKPPTELCKQSQINPSLKKPVKNKIIPYTHLLYTYCTVKATSKNATTINPNLIEAYPTFAPTTVKQSLKKTPKVTNDAT